MDKLTFGDLKEGDNIYYSFKHNDKRFNKVFKIVSIHTDKDGLTWFRIAKNRDEYQVVSSKNMDKTVATSTYSSEILLATSKDALLAALGVTDANIAIIR